MVTSESGSEADLVLDSVSSRVVHTQQNSPSPASATVVKEKNQNNIAQPNREKSEKNIQFQTTTTKAKFVKKTAISKTKTVLKMKKKNISESKKKIV